MQIPTLLAPALSLAFLYLHNQAKDEAHFNHFVSSYILIFSPTAIPASLLCPSLPPAPCNPDRLKVEVDCSPIVPPIP
jgi:hypothetical protein